MSLASVSAQLIAALRHALTAEGLEPPDIALQRPARAENGDLSTNVAFVMARQARRPPVELANAIAGHVAERRGEIAHLARVEAVAPGFVNFYLAPTWLDDVLREVVTAGEADYARHHVGQGTRVDIEFVSANPTGPLHAGAGRWAVYGDSLARVMERCGYEVEREYYLNDQGTQMRLFGESLAARRAGAEPPEGGYQGEYVARWAADMPEDAEPVEWGYRRAVADAREVLESLDIHFDTWFSERELYRKGAVDETLGLLVRSGSTYEHEGATWLRTTPFGEDKDRVIVRSTGEPTYVLADIAYHRDKLERGFDRLIDVLGADHHGYVARLRAGLAALGYETERLEVILGQLVVLLREGQPVRLSKRAGDLVELRDVVDETGKDATRLTFLLQALDSAQTVDLAVMKAMTMENPVYYVQYAHARIRSIERHASELGIERPPLDGVDLTLLRDESELGILETLARLPDVTLNACQARVPHAVVTWAREFADHFHAFYTRCRVTGEDVPPELTAARLWLIEAARVGLAVAFDLVGVTKVERMEPVLTHG
jgi:arginyl-tRNA synthetase